MNLSENILRVQSLMGLNESVFLKRRIPIQLLDDSFNESLSYWISNAKENMRKSKQPPPVFANMIHVVISMTIDEIHPELFSGREDFSYETYDEIFQVLTNRYFNQMEQAYNDNFPPQ
jgi:hypothetical protein